MKFKKGDKVRSNTDNFDLDKGKIYTVDRVSKYYIYLVGKETLGYYHSRFELVYYPPQFGKSVVISCNDLTITVEKDQIVVNGTAIPIHLMDDINSAIKYIKES